MLLKGRAEFQIRPKLTLCKEGSPRLYSDQNESTQIEILFSQDISYQGHLFSPVTSPFSETSLKMMSRTLWADFSEFENSLVFLDLNEIQDVFRV